MRVRVRAGARVMAVTAFGGAQYIQDEWRDVPAGCEAEALGHPYLEVEPEPEASAPEPPAPEPESPAPEPEPVKPAAPKRRTK